MLLKKNNEKDVIFKKKVILRTNYVIGVKLFSMCECVFILYFQGLNEKKLHLFNIASQILRFFF